MYVAQSNQCSVPNSANPPSKAAIRRGISILARMNTLGNNAQQAFACLLNRTDLNTNGWPLADFPGTTPASTITGCPSPNVPDTAIMVQGPTEPTGPTSGVNLTGLQYWPRRATTRRGPHGIAPNSQAAFAQPPAAAMMPLTTQAHSAQAKTFAQAAAASAAPAPVSTSCPAYPTTGNLCLDVMLNYVDPSQVSPTQLALCAQKGYSGNLNGPLLTTQMIRCRALNYGSLPKIPDNPNVPQYNSSMMPQGVSGLGDYDGCSFLGTLLAATAGTALAMWLLDQARKSGVLADLI